MITLNAVVRVFLSVVNRAGQEIFDHVRESRGPVCDDLFRFVACVEHGSEEFACCRDMAFRRDENVDDLAVFIDRPVDVSPDASDFYVGLVDEQTVPDRVADLAGCFDQDRRDMLYPTIQCGVIDFDAAFCEELCNIAV